MISGIPCQSLCELLDGVPWDELADGVPVVFHGDLQPENVIVSSHNDFTYSTDGASVVYCIMMTFIMT